MQYVLFVFIRPFDKIGPFDNIYMYVVICYLIHQAFMAIY